MYLSIYKCSCLLYVSLTSIHKTSLIKLTMGLRRFVQDYPMILIFFFLITYIARSRREVGVERPVLFRLRHRLILALVAGAICVARVAHIIYNTTTLQTKFYLHCADGNICCPLFPYRSLDAASVAFVAGSPQQLTP